MDNAPSKLCYGFTRETILNLRPLEKSKQLDGTFRYKAKSNVEKIIDAYRYYQNPLSTFSNKQAMAPHLIKKGLFKNNIDMLNDKKLKLKPENLTFVNPQSNLVPKPDQLPEQFRPKNHNFKIKNPEYVKKV